MGSKRLTPTTVGKIASKCLLLLYVQSGQEVCTHNHYKKDNFVIDELSVVIFDCMSIVFQQAYYSHVHEKCT